MPRANRHSGWSLAAVVCLALGVRLATVRFGLPGLNDPDELMFEMGALRMLRGLTLDPGWFGHPATTTMYVLALVDAVVFGVALLSGRVASARQFGDLAYADPTWVILPGRIAMVVFAAGTVWLTWRLTERLLGRQAAVAAALLLAVNPVHITWSQVIRSDGMACCFMLLCLQASLAIARMGRWRDYASAALWLGVSVATKWPFALSGLAMTGATVFAFRSGKLAPRQAAGRLLASAVGAAGVLILVSPYLVLHYSTVLRNLRGEGQAHHLGSNGGDMMFNLLWYTHGAFLTGFGVLGLLLIGLGTVRLLRQHEAFAIVGPVTLSFLLMLLSQRLVWERWALPLMVLGAVIAAAGLVEVTAWSRRRAGLRWLPAAVLLATLVPLGVRAWADGAARMNDTRQLAAAWARQHIPAGSTVLVEHQASDLSGAPLRLLFPIGDAGCVEIAALLHGRTGYATIDHDRAGRSNIDYGTLPQALRAGCRADFAILAQYDRYRQERTIFPAEYAAYASLLATGTVVATFSPADGRIGGPVVTIIDFHRRARR